VPWFSTRGLFVYAHCHWDILQPFHLETMPDLQAINVILFYLAIFGVQISNLKGISWGFDIFIYVLLGTCVLTFLYNMYNPYKRQKENRLNFNW
jgi:amino acid permease